MISMPAERTAEAVVMELMPNALVRVKLEGEHQVVAHLPSTQRANFAHFASG